MKNLKEKIIYVGKARSIQLRVRSYFTKLSQQSIKTQYLVSRIESIDYMVTHTEEEAFLLEASLIKKYRPKYNIRLKDDKSYPYIRCSTEVNFPRFYLSRKVKNDGSTYFGPYTRGSAVRDTINFMNRVYKIRDCKDQFMKSTTRACLTYQMGYCEAPCVDYITKEDYQRNVHAALKFLRGRDNKILLRLKEKMRSAAQMERFEAAAKLRDHISSMEEIWKKQFVVNPHIDLDQDVIAYSGDHRGTLIETLHVRKGRVIGNRQYFLSNLNVESPDEDHRDWLTSFINQYYSDNIIPDEIIIPLDLGDDIYRLLKRVFKQRQGVLCKIIYVHSDAHKKLINLAQSNANNHFHDQVSKKENIENTLNNIQKKLSLTRYPHRMECFDISHFQGMNSVASQVVFIDGLPQKNDYRKYKLRTVQGINDYASMKEVLERRFQHTEMNHPRPRSH